MTDPLSVIRNITISGGKLNIVNGVLIAGSFQVPDSTSTSFRRSLKASNEYWYTVRDVAIFLANSDLGEAEYRRKAVEAKASAIVKDDRIPLKNYLSGVISSCPQIDSHMATSFVQQSERKSEKVAESKVSDAITENFHAQVEKHAMIIARAIQRSSKRKRNGVDDEPTAGDDSEVMDKAFLSHDFKVLTKLREDEIPAQTRSSVLNSSAKEDFSVILKLFNEKILKKQTSSAAPTTATVKPLPTGIPPPPTAPGSRPTAAVVAAPVAVATVKAVPEVAPVKTRHSNLRIIIVPSALTSCITLLNVKEFLSEGTYISAEDKRRAGEKKPNTVKLLRDQVPDGVVAPMPYIIVDDPVKAFPAMAQDPALAGVNLWDHVVAVFSTGQMWQFKGWQYESPVTLFQNVLGVHAHLDSAQPDANALSWNCKVFKISVFKQHLNGGQAKEFWMYLDDFIKMHKPHLFPSPQGGMRPVPRSAPVPSKV